MRVVELGMHSFDQTWSRMRAFTDARHTDTEDELWVTEHLPVYTQGVAGKPEHLLANPTGIPVIHTDRGGQITYHGPGQSVVYCLIDLRRRSYGVRELVRRIENAVIAVLARHDVQAHARMDAPGVYVRGRKIASLGLKVRHGCTYHGVALNVDCDLAPFLNTNPCGLLGMKMTRCLDEGVLVPTAQMGRMLANELVTRLDI
jgi:lipoyl(octanoyl) transferase